MQITIIAVGKRVSQWVASGFEDYVRRFPQDFRVCLVEIPLARRTKGTEVSRLIHEEGERMLAAIPRASYVIALDERGRMWDTRQLAENLRRWRDEGLSLSLLIGGPDGLAPSCLSRADVTWSLSPLTLPHPLVRVLVAEQIYRGWSVLAQHPYHLGHE